MWTQSEMLENIRAWDQKEAASTISKRYWRHTQASREEVGRKTNNHLDDRWPPANNILDWGFCLPASISHSSGHVGPFCTKLCLRISEQTFTHLPRRLESAGFETSRLQLCRLRRDLTMKGVYLCLQQTNSTVPPVYACHHSHCFPKVLKLRSTYLKTPAAVIGPSAWFLTILRPMTLKLACRLGRTDDGTSHK